MVLMIVMYFLFLAGLSIVFSSGNQSFLFSKNLSPGKLSDCVGQLDDC